LNFKIQGENPGKIVSNQFNGTAEYATDFVHPIVVDCIKRTNASPYNYTYSYTVLDVFTSCIISTFEPKVNVSGWRCDVSIYNLFRVPYVPYKYRVNLHYYPLDVTLYV
jgi:hypothetical protein